MIAALVIPPRRDRVQCYFRLAPDASIDAVGVRAFLGHLGRVVRTPLTLVWDRSATRRGTRRLARNPRLLRALLRHAGRSLRLK